MFLAWTFYKVFLRHCARTGACRTNMGVSRGICFAFPLDRFLGIVLLRLKRMIRPATTVANLINKIFLPPRSGKNSYVKSPCSGKNYLKNFPAPAGAKKPMRLSRIGIVLPFIMHTLGEYQLILNNDLRAIVKNRLAGHKAEHLMRKHADHL